MQIEIVEGEDGNIAHRKDFPLNDFEDILDTFGDSKEIGNDCEEDSESVSNTKVTYYAYVSFLITCFKAKEKACKNFICLLGCKIIYVAELRKLC